MAANSGLPELAKAKSESRVNPTFDHKPGHDEERDIGRRSRAARISAEEAEQILRGR
jgi:hypothetical protein